MTYKEWLAEVFRHINKMPLDRRYCEYLAMHRYGGKVSEIWTELESKDKDSGANWIKATYGKYVANDADVIRYVMPSL